MPVSKIEVGDLDVFESGTVTTFGDDPLTFTLEHEADDEEMRLVFEFVEDGGEPRMEPADVDPAGTAKIHVYNHTGGEDVGPTDPFNVGVLAGRALHLIYHVNTVAREDGWTVRFSYTFYLGRSVDEEEIGGRDG